MAPRRSNWLTALVYPRTRAHTGGAGACHLAVDSVLGMCQAMGWILSTTQNKATKSSNKAKHKSAESAVEAGTRGRPGRQKERGQGQSLPGTLAASVVVPIFQQSANRFFFLNFIYIICGLLWYIKPHVIPKEYFDITNEVVHFDEIQFWPKVKEFEMPCSCLWETPICPI